MTGAAASAMTAPVRHGALQMIIGRGREPRLHIGRNKRDPQAGAGFKGNGLADGHSASLGKYCGKITLKMRLVLFSEKVLIPPYLSDQVFQAWNRVAAVPNLHRNAPPIPPPTRPNQ